MGRIAEEAGVGRGIQCSEGSFLCSVVCGFAGTCRVGSIGRWRRVGSLRVTCVGVCRDLGDRAGFLK